MKIVITALIESLSGIFNVLLIIIIIWLKIIGIYLFTRIMLAILGVNLAQGKMGYCTREKYKGVNKE